MHLENVSIVGGDAGISAYNNGLVSIGPDVSITGFRNSGIEAFRGSVVRTRAPVTVTGGSNQEGNASSAIVAVDQGVVHISGGTIAPASGSGISVADDTAAAVDSFRNGSITVRNATVNGTVWSGENSTVDLRSVTQSGGNIDAFRSGIIRVRDSDVTGGEGDQIYSGVFSVIRIDRSNVGNASGTGSINLYNFGIIDLRGTEPEPTNLNNRGINCADPREVRIINKSGTDVINVGAISCILP